MKKIQSHIDTSSDEFKKNYEYHQNITNQYLETLQKVTDQRSDAALKKHKSRGKLLVRERINLLIDQFTPFVELSPLSAYEQYQNQFPSAGIVTGIGMVSGIETVIIANDATVKGGTYIRETIKKHIRAQEIALQNNLPCIYLVDSGGVFLPEQANVFPDRFDFGRIFYNQAQLSARGLPQISVVMGSCTAGGAYVPAMSDETIIVKNQGTIFIGGPPLVKAATGEEVSAEELGGAIVHTAVSGVADHLAENDQHALDMCRDIFSYMQKPEPNPFSYKRTENPLYDASEIAGILPADPKKPINAYEIIARLVDGSLFQEFKSDYGKTLVTGFAHIKNQMTGVIANNGFLDAASARKGAHFVENCNHRKIPILFLQNITGFIVGKTHEHGGIARDGAKLIHAVANSVVPKITIVIGGSYGAGNYAMAGRAYDPNFLFMWPNARISVMGGEQASMVLGAVAGKQKNEKNSASQLIKQFEQQSSAYFSTSRLWDDGIVTPADTHDLLVLLLSLVSKTPVPEPKYGVFRM